MSTRQSAQAHDPEIIGLSGGILDGIVRLGNSGRPADLEAENEAVPLVRVARGAPSVPSPAVVAPAPPERVGVDSFAPSAQPTAPLVPLHAPTSRGSWAAGFVVAAGLACVLAAGALSRRAPQPRLEAAAQPAGVAAPPAALAREAPASPASRLVAPESVPADPIRAGEVTLERVYVVGRRHGAPADDAAAQHVDVTADLPALAEPPPPAAPFDRGAAAAAIARSAGRAASCLEEGAGSTMVPMSVTFAPSGRVTVATVTGGALVGTREGACVAGAVHAASVPGFEGASVTVNTSVRVR